MISVFSTMPHLLVQPPLPLDATIPISHTGPPLYKEPDGTDNYDWATYSAHQPIINQDSYYYEYKSPVIDILSEDRYSVEEGQFIVSNSDKAAFLDADIDDIVDQGAPEMELPPEYDFVYNFPAKIEQDPIAKSNPRDDLLD
jgi:hypothetical protein